MSPLEDTQLTDVSYKSGTTLENGKWRVEFDSMGQLLHFVEVANLFDQGKRGRRPLYMRFAGDALAGAGN
jgi:hypothetical protein